MKPLSELRAETPGCESRIHFNNAGAALMPKPVIDIQKKYLDLEAQLGGYEAADASKAEIEGFYTSMGELLGCGPHNIAFTSSATNAYARALSCIAFKPGDTILIANEDYISNQLAFLSMERRLGVRLLRADSLPEGGVDVDNMRALMDAHKPRLVSLTHVPTNTGLVQPVEEVGKLCRERNILYLVDGCQSAGQIPVDMKKIGCDFFSGTFRKFLRGPRGAGFLFISDNILNQDIWPLYVDMRGANWTDPNEFTLRKDGGRFEDWEFPYGLVLGSREAVRYALNVGIAEIEKRNVALCAKVRDGLLDLGLHILDKGKRQSSIITVNLPGKNPTEVLQQLRERKVNTSISYRGYAVIDYDAKGVTWGLRISPHYYNSEEEVSQLMQSLQQIL
ncbi:MAG: aminotransferase class V-fold PLP-dependent enzyme [Cyclobacteriaceae bacterium]|nr:aminotransferase class V-fold PLP-dependent enzyme [Cyclobacteriaceae bacterium]